MNIHPAILCSMILSVSIITFVGKIQDNIMTFGGGDVFEILRLITTSSMFCPKNNKWHINVEFTRSFYEIKILAVVTRAENGRILLFISSACILREKAFQNYKISESSLFIYCRQFCKSTFVRLFLFLLEMRVLIYRNLKVFSGWCR